MHRIRHIPRPAALLLHLAAMLTLLVYCAYRFYLADWSLVVIYSLSFIPLMLSFAKELKGVSSHVNRRMTLLLVSIGIAATSLEIGYAGLIFIFPTIFIYFFLFPLTVALVFSVLFSLVTLACGAQTEPMLMIVRFAIACANCIAFGAIFAYVVSNQRTTLITLAITDPLTGLYNRKKLNADLEELESAPGTGLLLIDIDHFKRINDEAGHLEGDRVLIEAGELIRALLPQTATAYRYGGEEFLLILPGTVAAEHTCQQLREGFKTIERPSDIGTTFVTCSMGLAYKSPRETISSWLKRADIALYQAKADGRDRICVARDAMTGPIAAKLSSPALSTEASDLV